IRKMKRNRFAIPEKFYFEKYKFIETYWVGGCRYFKKNKSRTMNFDFITMNRLITITLQKGWARNRVRPPFRLFVRPVAFAEAFLQREWPLLQVRVGVPGHEHRRCFRFCPF